MKYLLSLLFLLTYMSVTAQIQEAKLTAKDFQILEKKFNKQLQIKKNSNVIQAIGFGLISYGLISNYSLSKKMNNNEVEIDELEDYKTNVTNNYLISGIGALVSCVGLIIPIQSNRHENEELYTIDLSTNSLDVKNGKINLKRIKTVFKEGDSVSVKTLNGPVVVYGVLSIIANNRIELLDENGRAFVFYYGIIENLKLE